MDFLTPLLFNLYISDTPETGSRKFRYTDDWELIAVHRNFEETEATLTSDLAIMAHIFEAGD